MAQIYGYIPFADSPASSKQQTFWPLKAELDASNEFSILKVDEDHESYRCLRFSIADGDSTTIDVLTALGKQGRFIRVESTQDLRLKINSGDVIHTSDTPWTWDKFKFSTIYIENPSGYGTGIAEVQVIITG